MLTHREGLRGSILALPGLVGDLCDQIWFVRDYVMVILEHGSITCVNDPEIASDGAVYRFPEAGSRDALCALIEQRVQSAVQRDDGTVEVLFDRGARLSLSPFPEDRRKEFIYIQGRDW